MAMLTIAAYNSKRHPRAGRSGPYDGGRDARSAWTALKCKVVQLDACIATRTVRRASLAMHANYSKIYHMYNTFRS